MDEKVKDKDAEAAKTPTQDELDAGLEDTFPASDPVSSTQPGDKAEPAQK